MGAHGARGRQGSGTAAALVHPAPHRGVQWGAEAGDEAEAGDGADAGRGAGGDVRLVPLPEVVAGAHGSRLAAPPGGRLHQAADWVSREQGTGAGHGLQAKSGPGLIPQLKPEAFWPLLCKEDMRRAGGARGLRRRGADHGARHNCVLCGARRV
jgi:hypothetical protein